ncbi:hypothetical protein Rhopal_000644-T1 [Rhodotorula paludigena]|uniref:Sterol 3-beta-glucosyltransferase n=1 Tax=Rhodotorula paludigena TaxID=86838 RepID=A0AAV5GCW0_9BASI|nr:hypothetical protein Rhopal_000644-T1 [Rhodotorula paludigena]
MQSGLGPASSSSHADGQQPSPSSAHPLRTPTGVNDPTVPAVPSEHESPGYAGWGEGGERHGAMGRAALRQQSPDPNARLVPPEDAAALEHGHPPPDAKYLGGPHPGVVPTGHAVPVRTASDDSLESGYSATSSSASSSFSGSDDSAPPAHFPRAEVSDTEADAGAGIGGAGYGMAARSLDEDEARRQAKAERKRFGQEGGAKSYHGGMSQGYMRMIHALAQDDEDEERRASRKDKKKKHHRHGLKKHPKTDDDVDEGEDVPAIAAAKHEQLTASDFGAASSRPAARDEAQQNTSDETSHSVSTESGGDAHRAAGGTADDSGSSSAAENAGPDLAHFTSPPERAAENPSLARCPSEGVVSKGDAQHRRTKHRHHHPHRPHRRHREDRDDAADEDDVDDDPMSKSSIFAIHRPHGARDKQRRRRAKVLEEVREAEASATEDDGEASALDEENDEGEGDDASPRSKEQREEARAQKTRKRREKLAVKLMDVFGLDEPEEVVAEYACWLFRSILLQGFLYLTAGHLCFYAYLAQKEGATIRSGSLSVRSSRTRRYRKHWFVLKDSVLSWFPSSTDPYFPDGHIDLHYCIAVEPSSFHKHHFKVSTADKKWHFSADSEASRDEWVKTLKKVVFRSQNEGESVKIAIPLETIIDVEKSSSLEFAETIRVRVYDADEGYSIDEYWLSYFKDLDGALDRIQAVLETFRQHHPQGSAAPLPRTDSDAVEDTTRPVQGALGDTDQVRAADGERDHATARDERSLSERVHSVLGIGSSSSDGHSKSTATMASTAPPAAASSEDAAASAPAPSAPTKLRVTTDLADKDKSAGSASGPASGAGSVATLKPPRESSGGDNDELAAAHKADSQATSPTAAPAAAGLQPPAPPDPRAPSRAHTYPPEPSPGPEPEPARRTSTLSKVLSAPVSAASLSGRKILEVVTHSSSSATGRKRTKTSRSGSGGGRNVLGGRVVEEPEEEEEAEEEGGQTEAEKEAEIVDFRKTFGLADKEDLLHQLPAYLYRGLPIYGRAYISSNYFCFRSGGVFLGKTKMLLPINDIIGVSKHRSYRIGFSGLMVTIKGHEEVFFELNSVERRDSLLADLDAQRELVKQQHREREGKGDDKGEHRELRELVDLSASKGSIRSPLDVPHPQSEAVPGQPPIMFSSTTSDFITFKPEKSLRFTCLTIGSRGDVQPYIALCKGLMAEGHHCKIASHGEYRKWVEGHGIEFAAVGGDPAELMQLMISHDFFTISFMKEAVGRFRGWLDDLLASAWEGCRNSDVLIESPSAIAGYHIAEALQIPYYRAFTMPWSKTRAYPHAFAVPEVHMGGGYNYMTYTMFDQVFWRATSGQVNRWRKSTLKIGPTSMEAMQQQKIPFLYNFSPVVIPPPLDWRENIHVTGYWWLDNPDDSKSNKWEPPQDLLDFLDQAKSEDKKVVFIGFGSIIIPDPLEMTRVVSEAVERAGVYAIVAKGWSDRQGDKDDQSEEQKRKQEENEKRHNELMDKPFIYNVKSIPHDWLFPRISAAVHHGGAGTTGASLRAGLPTIIKPFFGDQHFYADRVATLGIGTHIRNFTVDNLANALTTAVTDEKQIERARLAGEEIRKEDGVATAIECIYRDLEYARSLIPKPSGPGQDSTHDSSSSSSSENETDEKATEKKRRGSKDAAAAQKASEPTAPVSPSAKSGAGGSSALSSSGGASGPRSPQNESRTTSSDEGWDVMSRGSAAETSTGGWDDNSFSRGSSTTRDGARSRSLSRVGTEGGEETLAEEEEHPGLTARMLGFLGKPVKVVKKDA